MLTQTTGPRIIGHWPEPDWIDRRALTEPHSAPAVERTHLPRDAAREPRGAMRLALIVIACGAFALLGLRDVATGNAAIGAASVMIAIANAILLTR